MSTSSKDPDSEVAMMSKLENIVEAGLEALMKIKADLRSTASKGEGTRKQASKEMATSSTRKMTMKTPEKSAAMKSLVKRSSGGSPPSSGKPVQSHLTSLESVQANAGSPSLLEDVPESSRGCAESALRESASPSLLGMSQESEPDREARNEVLAEKLPSSSSDEEDSAENSTSKEDSTRNSDSTVMKTETKGNILKSSSDESDGNSSQPSHLSAPMSISHHDLNSRKKSWETSRSAMSTSDSDEDRIAPKDLKSSLAERKARGDLLDSSSDESEEDDTLRSAAKSCSDSDEDLIAREELLASDGVRGQRVAEDVDVDKDPKLKAACFVDVENMTDQKKEEYLSKLKEEYLEEYSRGWEREIERYANLQ